MIDAQALTAGIRIVRAEEAGLSVIIGGLIPFLGIVALSYIVWRAVKSNPENDPIVYDDPEPAPPQATPPEGEKEGGPEGPPSLKPEVTFRP